MSRNPPEKCLSTWDQQENHQQNSGNLVRGIIYWSGAANYKLKKLQLGAILFPYKKCVIDKRT